MPLRIDRETAMQFVQRVYKAGEQLEHVCTKKVVTLGTKADSGHFWVMGNDAVTGTPGRFKLDAVTIRNVYARVKA